MPVGSLICAFVLALLLTRALLRRFGRFALDHPNERSLHDRPVPRTGGIAILAGATASLGFGAGQLWIAVSIALALAALSLVDDLRGIPALLRLLGHFSAAAVFTWYVLSPMDAVHLVLLVVVVVWLTNLYNFMDGSDGLAAGMSTIGFGAYALAAYLVEHMPLAALAAAISAASAAFSLYNFHPARIFLGDVGSIPLGFLSAAIGLFGWREDAWPLWFPIFVFAPFVADATMTLLKRLVRGVPVWRAHREHYYQRLVRMGFGHRGTALLGYAIMLVCAAAALIGRAQPPAMQAVLFMATSALLAALAVWVDVRWARLFHEGETA